MAFYIILITTTFSCKISQSSSQDGKETIVNGIIKPLGISTFQYGSHVLIGSNDQILFVLRSETVELDQFIDQNVEIGVERIKGYPVDGGPIFMEVKWIKTKSKKSH